MDPTFVSIGGRARRVVKAKRAQTCAASCVKSLRKVCLEVVEKKGAASSG